MAPSSFGRADARTVEFVSVHTFVRHGALEKRSAPGRRDNHTRDIAGWLD